MDPEHGKVSSGYKLDIHWLGFTATFNEPVNPMVHAEDGSQIREDLVILL